MSLQPWLPAVSILPEKIGNNDEVEDHGVIIAINQATSKKPVGNYTVNLLIGNHGKLTRN